MRALGRILRTWSLIKFVPMRSILPLQAPLLRLLSTRSDLSEDQLVALGIKRLYSSRTASKRGKSVATASDVVSAIRSASDIVEAGCRKTAVRSE
jgi:PhoPQ-activated pathogenicity-related protein